MNIQEKQNPRFSPFQLVGHKAISVHINYAFGSVNGLSAYLLCDPFGIPRSRKIEYHFSSPLLFLYHCPVSSLLLLSAFMSFFRFSFSSSDTLKDSLIF
jgi:hypothetical protein